MKEQLVAQFEAELEQAALIDWLMNSFMFNSNTCVLDCIVEPCWTLA